MQIYLDYNATTPVDPRVFEKMKPYYLEHFANANSAHLSGILVSDALETAIEEVAMHLGVASNQLVFNSGATEGINTLLKGLLFQDKRTVISVTTEHNAVLDSLNFLEQNGFNIYLSKVSDSGEICLEDIASLLNEDTAMLVVMLANNETGVIHPIKEVAQLAHEKGVKILCDATQAIGKINVNISELDVDYLVASAHKFYGPKGVGLLYAKQNLYMPWIHGGGQQRNLRSGTINVPGIIGFAEALKIGIENKEIEELRNHLERDLLQIPDTYVNGGNDRLPNTSNICFKEVDSQQLIRALKYISVSNGAACSSVTTQPSHVLKAMGLSNEDALSSIRFSLGRFTTENDILETVIQVKKWVNYFRNGN